MLVTPRLTSLLEAVSAFLVNMLHTLLMIGMVDGIRRKSMLRVVGVVAIHMAYSCMVRQRSTNHGCSIPTTRPCCLLWANAVILHVLCCVLCAVCGQSIAHDNSPGCTTVLLVQGALVLAALAWSTLVIRSSTYYARRQAAALRD